MVTVKIKGMNDIRTVLTGVVRDIGEGKTTILLRVSEGHRPETQYPISVDFTGDDDAALERAFSFRLEK